ncbi:MAG: hypothetical protein Hals2KO_14520 [Halioglobus sp.]
MKIKFQGELSIPALRQAIFEQLLELEDQYSVRHSKKVALYITPTNGFGDEIYCRDVNGKEVQVIFCNGPYRCAADDYEL